MALTPLTIPHYPVMVYFTRLSLPIFWAAVITFSQIIYGGTQKFGLRRIVLDLQPLYLASISADGTPSGFIRPSLPARKRTDFNGIFSDIKNHKVTPLHDRESIIQRDVPPAPDFFSLVFGPVNAANNADGVSISFTENKSRLKLAHTVHGVCVPSHFRRGQLCGSL